jgi:hypothetical protein
MKNLFFQFLFFFFILIVLELGELYLITMLLNNDKTNLNVS